MRVRFWGTRGSIASPGAETVRFGGNTSCMELVTNEGKRLIFDCGTGARALGLNLARNEPQPIRASILLSHTHWDHIQGFPFFAPLFIAGNEFTIYAPEGVGLSLASVLAGQMEFTYFPVELGQLPSKITYRDLSEGVHDIGGVRVISQYLNHPATTLGYRVEADGVVVMYLTDHEPFSDTMWRADSEPGKIASILHAGDRRHAEFMAGADLVIHDSQYTPEEYPAKKNWGHSTYKYVVEVAAAAGVRKVALYHHDPLHDDNKLLYIESRAKMMASRRRPEMDVFCASEGSGITITPTSFQITTHADAAGSILPAPTKSEHPSALLTSKPDEVSTHPPREGKLRVLVVDDDANVRLLAQTALSKEYLVEEAEDGQQGLEQLEKYPTDLVLLDLNMPKMGGLEMLEIIRSRPASKNLPVLVLTAYGDEKSTRSGFDAGATDYLTKPFTIPQLATRVRACFTRTGESAHEEP